MENNSTLTIAEKKERVKKLLDRIMKTLTPQEKLMVQMFYPRFLLLLENADDDYFESMIEKIKLSLMYIEGKEDELQY